MNDRTMLRTGIVGSTVAAICCFTPALVILLGALGLTAWVGWLDYALLPALALFVALTGVTLIRLRRGAEAGDGRAGPRR